MNFPLTLGFDKRFTKIILAIALAFFAGMTTLVISTPKSEPIHSLYVFGDSLSDTGTVFQATGGMYPPNPPYFQGRYSNGRVWVEYLGEQLQLSPRQIHGFAYGGATARSDRNSLVPGLLAQVQSFTQSQQSIDPGALYIVWSGANDYLQGEANPKAPVDAITEAIATLARVGAKKVLVANLPDLGHLPATRTTSDSARLSTLTQTHNQTLRRALKVVQQQHSDLQIATLDVHFLYQEAIANPAKFGLSNVTGACLVGASVCAHPEQFLFWDGIHPTTVAHRILGTAALNLIQDESLLKT